MTAGRRRKSSIKLPPNLVLWAVLVLAIVGFVREMSTSCNREEHLAKQKLYVPTAIDSLMHVEVSPEVASSTELIEYPGFIVRFDPNAHEPQYVAWELTPEKCRGNIGRANTFAPDENVEGCATLADYKGSTYSRGHMAPSADMKWDADAMTACFLLTNMCPQSQELNGGAWKSVEDKCRQWTMRDSTLVIVCGPVLTDRITQKIGDSGVLVPKRFFKVILAPYANPPRGIGFVMPNGRVPGGMQACAVSIDDVEQITGFDFFSALPDSIENQVERECNFPRWSAKK